MARFNLDPSREDLRKFGTLAYVDEAERTRIMGLPAGQSQRAIEALCRQIEMAGKKGKR